ncbi:hypothetical protein [Streptomyces coeruleorubidus]|uniref:hypothetical protein n=1 Tax=Streptomyces coeruleorubidus TaxID=116188 RepID=UPI0033CA4C16
MAVMTDALVPALEDAREAHEAVVDRLRADVTLTPPGPYRQMLERQVDDVQDSVQRIEHHVRELRPRSGLVGDSVDIARFISRSAVRTVMLPLAIGSTFVTEMLRGRRPNDERRLLRNAEDEYAVTARALAACRAGQSIAEEVRDQATAGLLAALRRQDEELLERLEDSVAQNARAVAASANGFAQNGGGWTDLAARAVRATADRVQDVAQNGGRRARGAAEGAVREMPDTTRMAEEVQGAVTREQELPIARFSQLSVDDIKHQLRSLSQSDLTVMEGYERTHANRPGVLDAIEQLRGSEPWDGYDTMNPDKITAQLQNVPSSVARQVLEYERSHRQRREVISAAETRTAP